MGAVLDEAFGVDSAAAALDGFDALPFSIGGFAVVLAATLRPTGLAAFADALDAGIFAAAVRRPVAVGAALLATRDGAFARVVVALAVFAAVVFEAALEVVLDAAVFAAVLVLAGPRFAAAAPAAAFFGAEVLAGVALAEVALTAVLRPGFAAIFALRATGLVAADLRPVAFTALVVLASDSADLDVADLDVADLDLAAGLRAEAAFVAPALPAAGLAAGFAADARLVIAFTIAFPCIRSAARSYCSIDIE